MVIDIQLRFHPKEPAFPCARDGTLSDTVFPIYYRVINYAYEGKQYKGVVYEVNYQYNYAIGLNDFRPRSSVLGYHVGDVERIMVIHDIDSDNPVKVFMSAHSQEGRWFEYDECEKDGDRLVVYVALNSHRHCNKAMINWRMLGFANDYTSNKGRHINMTAIEDQSIDTPIWNQEVMGNAFRSFFLPLYVAVLPKLKKDELKRESDINSKI